MGSVAQSCPSLWNPMNSSLPGSSVHGIFQTRVLEWVSISYSRGSSWPRDQTHISCISCIGRWILTTFHLGISKTSYHTHTHTHTHTRTHTHTQKSFVGLIKNCTKQSPTFALDKTSAGKNCMIILQDNSSSGLGCRAFEQLKLALMQYYGDFFEIWKLGGFWGWGGVLVLCFGLELNQHKHLG